MKFFRKGSERQSSPNGLEKSQLYRGMPHLMSGNLSFKDCGLMELQENFKHGCGDL